MLGGSIGFQPVKAAGLPRPLQIAALRRESDTALSSLEFHCCHLLRLFGLDRERTFTGYFMANELETITQHFEVYSPRSGYPESYIVTVSSSEFIVKHATFTARCSLAEDGKLTWAGHAADSGNALTMMLAEDWIYIPEILPESIEWALNQWQSGAISESELVDGLRELFAWIDQIGRSKPVGALWQRFVCDDAPKPAP